MDKIQSESDKNIVNNEQYEQNEHNEHNEEKSNVDLNNNLYINSNISNINSTIPIKEKSIFKHPETGEIISKK